MNNFVLYLVATKAYKKLLPDIIVFFTKPENLGSWFMEVPEAKNNALEQVCKQPKLVPRTGGMTLMNQNNLRKRSNIEPDVMMVIARCTPSRIVSYT